MKYIDADKLKQYIEHKRDCACDGLDWDDMDECQRFAVEYIDDILSFITSLQPELPGYDKALLEVKSKVDELYEEAGIGLCEYDTGLYNGIAETCMKLRGFIKARLDSDEQPAVDFEKTIKDELPPMTDDEELGLCICDHFGNHRATMKDIREILLHIYELGKSTNEKSEEKALVLTLADVVTLDNIIMKMVGEGYNDGYKTRPFYEEVVRRFNEGKEE